MNLNRLMGALLAVGAFALIGCGEQRNGALRKPEAVASIPSEVSVPSTSSSQSLSQQSSRPLSKAGLQEGREYDIAREADMRDGPGIRYARRINRKASDMFGTTQYLSVDTSVTVRLIQVKDNWAEVQITQPDYLSASHRGWIPKECIQGGASSAKLDGWIKQKCRVYRAQSTAAEVAGFLVSPAAVGVADDGSGWLRLIHGPVRAVGTEQFLASADLDAGLYIESANFTITSPGKWVK